MIGRTLVAFLYAQLLFGAVVLSAEEPVVVATQADFRLDARSDAGTIERVGSSILVASLGEHDENWALQIQIPPLKRPITKGDAFCVSFEARSIGDEGEMHLLMAKNDPFEVMQHQDGFRSLTVPNRWHPYRVCFRASRDFPANEVYAAFQLALGKQQIQIRQLQVVDYGQAANDALPFSLLHYSGRNDGSWREEAARRIRQHRQADVLIRVRDSDGNPVVGAPVRVRQQRHAYAFGTFVGNTPLGGDNLSSDDTQRFAMQAKRWFNRVTLPRYWADWGTDTEQGKARADQVADWAQGEGFDLKTHLLLYPQFIPERVKKLASDPQAFRMAIESAMDEALARTRDLDCVAWDAINELRDETLVGDVLGTPYYADIFNRAQAAQPNVKWFINEYGILTGGKKRHEFLQTYLDQIKQIRRDGGALEGIGLQGHFQDSLITVEETWEILDRLATFGLPIEITEFDVDTRDEQTQALFTGDFLTAVFSHPATAGFTTWGFWQGDMWRPQGAMLRTDWTVKPNGLMWQEMIYNRWWTDAYAVTDNEGAATVRVFKGTHNVESGTANQTVEVLSDREVVLTGSAD